MRNRVDVSIVFPVSARITVLISGTSYGSHGRRREADAGTRDSPSWLRCASFGRGDLSVVAEARAERRRGRRLRDRAVAARDRNLDLSWRLWSLRALPEPPSIIPLSWDVPPTAAERLEAACLAAEECAEACAAALQGAVWGGPQNARLDRRRRCLRCGLRPSGSRQQEGVEPLRPSDRVELWPVGQPRPHDRRGPCGKLLAALRDGMLALARGLLSNLRVDRDRLRPTGQERAAVSCGEREDRRDRSERRGRARDPLRVWGRIVHQHRRHHGPRLRGRLDSSRFVVCKGHELADIERVTERTPEYLVVEKAGRAPRRSCAASPTGHFPSRRGSEPGRPRLPAAP